MQEADQKVLQRHLARFLVEDVFNTVTADEILRIKAPNVWEHKGSNLTEGQVNALRQEAEIFKNSGLWKVLRSELLWLARAGYSRSIGESDLVAVKVLELFVKTIDEKLERMTVI